MARDMYELMNVSAGLELPGPSLMVDGQAYSNASLAIIIIFYSTLWSIKFSFLLFFRRLGKNVRRQKLLWWPVLGFTLGSYMIAVGIIQYRCLVKSFLYIMESCTTDSAINYQRFSLLFSCILDVLTDISSWQIFPLFLSRLTEIPSHVDSNHLALGGSNETPKKTGARWYFLARYYYHRFRNNPHCCCHNFDKIARHLLAIYVELNRDYCW